MILIIQRYFLKLHRLIGSIENGQSVDEAVRAIKPPVHFRQRDALMAQARLWSSSTLEHALRRISDTALSARRTSNLEDTLGERLLLALSAMASASAASRRR
jgi:DNA polymerase III subunit delta